MSPERLQIESTILRKFFPNKFQFQNLNTKDEYLDVGIKVQSGKVYRIRVETTNDYPSSMPKVYLTFPLPIYKKDGTKITGVSHEMHTLTNKGEFIQICHYKSENWNANATLYRVILKARIWLEAYEGHLKTSKPIDAFLKS